MNFNQTQKDMRLLFTLLILISTSFPAISQVSGFLGKKLVVGIEAPAMVKFGFLSDHDYTYGSYNPDGYYNQDVVYKQARLRYRPTIRLEFVISRKSSIQGVVRVFSPMADASSFSTQTRQPGGYTDHKTYRPKDRVKMKSMNFGLSYKWYAGDALSPIGIYQTVGLEYAIMKFEFTEDSFSSFTSRGTQKIEYGTPTPEETSIFIITYGVGKQYALSNMILMNLGLELGLPLRLSKVESSYEIENWADKTGAVETRHHSLISVVLGFSLAL